MDKKLFGLGAIPSLFDLRDYRGKAKECFSYCFADSFSLEMPPVKNQGAVCSCVAHGLATAIEFFDSKETGTFHKMSTDYIYGNRRLSSWNEKGMMMRDAIKTAKKYGDVYYRQMPGNTEVPDVIGVFENKAEDLYYSGNVNKIGRYFKLDSDDAIKACLIDYGPVLISVDWYSDYTLDGDMLRLNGKHKDGAHCLVIYGWCPNGWLVQNSWGTRWGSGGRAILPYETSLNEAWGIEDAENTVGDNWLDIVKPFSSDFGKKLAKIINAILNKIFKR